MPERRGVPARKFWGLDFEGVTGQIVLWRGGTLLLKAKQCTVSTWHFIVGYSSAKLNLNRAEHALVEKARHQYEIDRDRQIEREIDR
jgi:hypothetical protein